MYSVSGWLILVLLPHYKKGNYSIIKIELFPFRNLTTLENTCLWIYWPENHMNTRYIKFWGSYIFVHHSISFCFILTQVQGELPFEPEYASFYPDVCFSVEGHKFLCHKVRNGVQTTCTCASFETQGCLIELLNIFFSLSWWKE